MVIGESGSSKATVCRCERQKQVRRLLGKRRSKTLGDTYGFSRRKVLEEDFQRVNFFVRVAATLVRDEAKPVIHTIAEGQQPSVLSGCLPTQLFCDDKRSRLRGDQLPNRVGEFLVAIEAVDWVQAIRNPKHIKRPIPGHRADKGREDRRQNATTTTSTP